MKPEETSLNLKASSPAQVNHQAPLLMRTKKTTKKKKIMGLNRWFQPLGLWDRSWIKEKLKKRWDALSHMRLAELIVSVPVVLVCGEGGGREVLDRTGWQVMTDWQLSRTSKETSPFISQKGKEMGKWIWSASCLRHVRFSSCRPCHRKPQKTLSGWRQQCTDETLSLFY